MSKTSPATKKRRYLLSGNLRDIPSFLAQHPGVDRRDVFTDSQSPDVIRGYSGPLELFVQRKSGRWVADSPYLYLNERWLQNYLIVNHT